MKQIEIFLTLDDYLDSLKTRNHAVPNVSQLGDIGEELYVYDRKILTYESNPVLFNIATGAGWNLSLESGVTRYELGLVDINSLVNSVAGNTALTSFNEFGYFTNISFIPKATFSGCTSLMEITIPDSVRTIEVGAFDDFPPEAKIKYAGDESLIEFVSASNAINASYSANSSSMIFYTNSYAYAPLFRQQLEFVCISGVNNYVFIAGEDFKDTLTKNSGITPENFLYVTFYIKNEIVSLSDVAFSNSSVLEITLPNQIKTIGENTFMGCSKLESVILPNTLPALPVNTFSGCTNLRNITMPDTISSYGEKCFIGCTSLSAMPVTTNLQSIGNSCFSKCSFVTANIPNTVSTIGNLAFASAYTLTSVTIGSNVESIGNYCFAGCSGLTNITSLAVNEPEIENITFGGIARNGTLTYPENSDYSTWLGVTSYYLGFLGWNNIDTRIKVTYSATSTSSGTRLVYGTAATNSSFEKIELADGTEIPLTATAFTFQTLGINDVYFTLKTGNITASGFAYCTNIVTIELNDSVTGINKYCFSHMTNLKNITIPKSVKTVSDYAFAYCDKLTGITIEQGVRDLGGSCFYSCTTLVDLTVPDSVTGLGSSCFASCRSLTGLTIGSGVSSFGGNLVFQCYNLRRFYGPYAEDDGRILVKNNVLYAFAPSYASYVYCENYSIPEGIVSLANFAFAGCTYLTAVTIPETITQINEGCFSLCSGLTAIEIPDTVTSLGSGTFSGCTKLTAVTIGSGITQIASHCFYNCISLKNVTIPNQIVKINSYAFYSCGLSEISIPDSITEIGAYGFAYNYKAGEITIGTGVTKIGSNAFRDIPLVVSDFHNNSGLDEVTNNYWGAVICDNLLDGVLYVKGNYAVRCKTSATYVSIPDYITVICGSCFSDCTNVETLIIGNGISGISGTLAACIKDSKYKLTDVVIGSGVTALPSSAFMSSYNLTAITLPDSVTGFGQSCFYNCGLSSINIPSGVTSIPKGCFMYCSSLSALPLYEGITNIGDSAFTGCHGVSSLTIPSTVTGIGTNAFARCIMRAEDFHNNSSLDEVTNNYWGAFICEVYDGYLYYSGSTAIKCLNVKTVVIPDFITTVSGGCFSRCRDTENLTIGNGITNMNNIFYSSYAGPGMMNQANIKYVRVGTGLTYLGRDLSAATNLETIIFDERPDGSSGCIIAGNDTYGSGSLCAKKKLTTISFGKNSISTLSDSALTHLEISEIALPDGLKSIGNGVFAGTPLTSITIPSSVSSISSNAFLRCGFIEENFVNNSTCSSSTNWDAIIASTASGYTTNDGLLIDGDTLKFCYWNTSSVTIPTTVTYIGNAAFEDHPNLTSLTIPDSVTNIGHQAFYGTKLETVTVGSGVTYLGTQAFQYCRSLESITFSSPITGMGSYEFGWCDNLTGVTFSDGITFLGENCFSNCKSLVSVTLPNSITTISSSCFSYCSALSAMTIPDSVTTIGAGCFNGCNSLKTLTIGSGVTTIGRGICSNCSSLETFVGKFSSDGGRVLISGSTLFAFAPYGIENYSIPSNVTKLGQAAFSSAGSLKTVTIPNSVTTIDINCFDNCSGLTNVTIPNSVTTIGDYCFRNCKSLTSITLPNSITLVAQYIFYGCESLSAITIPNTVTTLGLYSFYGCTALSDITIPSSVTTIRNYCFYNCTNLKSITCNAVNAPTVWSGTFQSVGRSGILHYPAGSNYSAWLKTTIYYLGYYDWVGQEITG